MKRLFRPKAVFAPMGSFVAHGFLFIFVPIAYAFVWLVRRSPNHAAVVHHA